MDVILQSLIYICLFAALWFGFGKIAPYLRIPGPIVVVFRVFFIVSIGIYLLSLAGGIATVITG